MEFNKAGIFKWWYAKGLRAYNDLFEEKTAQLVAMTREGEIVRKEAPLSIESGQIVIADCGAEGKFYLTPNQWVSPRTEVISGFWLLEKGSCELNTPSVLGVYNTIEDGTAIILPPEGMELFGKSSTIDRTLTHRLVDAIVPIDNEKCIVHSKEDNRQAIISTRETDDSVIKIFMDRIHR